MAVKKLSVFKKIADAPSDRPDYQKGTRCIERIDQIKFGKNREENYFVAFEKTVLIVTTDAKGTEYGEKDYAGDLVGDCVSQVFSLAGKQKDYAMRELRQFLKSVVEVSEDELNDGNKVNDLLMEICGVEGIDDDDNIVYTGEQPLQNVFIQRHDWVKAGKGKADDDGNVKPVAFTNTKYVRAVPAAEVQEELDEKTIERLFPDGLLERLVADEVEEAE